MGRSLAVPPAETPESTAVRRLELPDTPTPAPLASGDDPRAILDGGQPDYLDSFGVPGMWFDCDNPGVADYRHEDGHLLGVDYEPEKLRRGYEPRELSPFAPAEILAAGPGASNRLGIYGYAGGFILFLSGSPVGEAIDRDYTLSYGQPALSMRASQTFDLTATIHDFAFWQLPFIP